MLEEQKRIYQECANLIPNWKELSKSELANLYIENENTNLANSYLSAIILKYWNLIGSSYYKQSVKVANEYDCYDFLISGILTALEKRVWKDPSNALYNDKIGPEKAMSVCIFSRKVTFYQEIKHDKRILNYSSLSLDQLEENSSDGFFIKYEDKYSSLNDYVKKLVVDYFNVKDYFACFFIDSLFNFNMLSSKEKNNYYVNISKFMKHINSINDEYFHQFAIVYGIEESKVKSAFRYIKLMPHYRIHSNLSRIMNSLKKDEYLKDFLGGD